MANIITGVRIVCAAGLLFCPMFSPGFFLLYGIGGVSDVLDGMAARHLGTATTFGARLDTVADILFFVTVLVKLIRTVYIPAWITFWIIAIAILKAVNIAGGIVWHRQFVSVHSAANKICGVLLFAIPPCAALLPQRAVMVLIVTTCVLATAAAIQEWHIIRTGENRD